MDLLKSTFYSALIGGGIIAGSAMENYQSVPQKAFAADKNDDGISDLVLESKSGRQISFLKIDGEYVRQDVYLNNISSKIKEKLMYPGDSK